MTFKQSAVHFLVWWAMYGAIIAIAIHFNLERAVMIGFAGTGVGAQLTIERQRREYRKMSDTFERYVDRQTK